LGPSYWGVGCVGKRVWKLASLAGVLPVGLPEELQLLFILAGSLYSGAFEEDCLIDSDLKAFHL